LGEVRTTSKELRRLDVPVIDLAEREDAKLRRAIDAACARWGIFQVVHHGVSERLLAQTLGQMREFFALPHAAKDEIRRSAENAWGFNDRELTKNEVDWKEIFDVGRAIDSGPLAGDVPQWPKDLPRFRETIEAFASACEHIARRLVDAIAVNLGAAPDQLEAAFPKDHTSFMRLNYYPECQDAAPANSGFAADAGRFGIQHHTDAGALTIMLQDEQPGLQVFHDDEWVLIEPTAGALVVNIGDVVQVWSNDRYRAPIHRVLASPDRPRYSAPFFFNPACDTTYAPLPSACADDAPPRYRPIRWEEFRAARAAGDYANIGKEIQISDFAMPSPSA
jgi:isopenicillin N synthase-like dioxygenase